MNHSGDTNKMVGADHFPDATKMVSDTPRTKAVNQYLRTRRDYTKTDHEVWMNYGIQLERELAAANERIKRLEKAGDALYLNSELTRWDSLQAANRKLNDQEAWRKAKEDKP